MATHAIQWGEGLFLRPHHFQIGDRWVQESISVSENWNVGYAYGLRKIEIDYDALPNWRVSLSACHVRLQDGTHLRYPEDAILAPVEIPRDAFAKGNQRAMVYLAVPRLQMGRQNASANGAADDCRFVVDNVETEDENMPGNPQEIAVRWPNVRLVIGDKDSVAGYEALPIMRLKVGATESATPQIDPDYIPPILACDAWMILQRDIITSIYDYLSATADKQAQQMVNGGVHFESGGKRDLELLWKMHSVNIALSYVTQLAFARGVHPFSAYTELCRTVGLIAIFDAKVRRLPALPLYDHDDLGSCFWKIRQILIPPPTGEATYFMRRFRGAGLQMSVRLEPEWLGPKWAFYIGVETKLSFSEVRALLNVDRTETGGMDFTVASSEQVDHKYNRAMSGVRLVAEPDPPPLLPATNWTYYRVDRRSESWQDVERTHNLGIRFNERQVEGNFDKEERIYIRHRGSDELVSISFALFAMENK